MRGVRARLAAALQPVVEAAHSGELTLNAANGQASIPAFGYPAFKMGTLKVSPGIDSQSIQVVGQACDVLAIGRERMR